MFQKKMFLSVNGQLLSCMVIKLLNYYWYQIEDFAPENTMILKPKPCSFPLQSCGCYKYHFCIQEIF